MDELDKLFWGEAEPAPAPVTPEPTKEEEVTEEVEEEEVEETKPAPEKKPEEKPKEAPKPPAPEKPVEFDYSEEKGTAKQVYMIYGLKGHGKTTLALNFPGTIACISFDRKSKPVADKLKSATIKVYDGIRYIDESTPQQMLATHDLNFRYLDSLLSELAKNKPDWIVIDGSEVLERICEMTMRNRNNLEPFQGIANRNLWKERRMYIRQIHNKALEAAKKGVIYSTYVDKDEIIVDGELVTKQDVPRWIDAIMYETDTVIKVTSRAEKTGRKFFAEVESSKTGIPTGLHMDITNNAKAFIEKIR